MCEEESSSVFLEECPAGWEPELKQDGSVGQHCYKLYLDDKTWQAAQTECENYGAHLAHIEDDETNAFYEHMVINYIFGLTQIKNYLLGKVSGFRALDRVSTRKR